MRNLLLAVAVISVVGLACATAEAGGPRVYSNYRGGYGGGYGYGYGYAARPVIINTLPAPLPAYRSAGLYPSRMAPVYGGGYYAPPVYGGGYGYGGYGGYGGGSRVIINNNYFGY